MTAEFLSEVLGMWETLKVTADFAGKEGAVREFNRTHRWRKRGLIGWHPHSE